MFIMLHLILLLLLHVSHPKHYLVETEGETKIPGKPMTELEVPGPPYSLENLDDNSAAILGRNNRNSRRSSSRSKGRSKGRRSKNKNKCKKCPECQKCNICKEDI